MLRKNVADDPLPVLLFADVEHHAFDTRGIDASRVARAAGNDDSPLFGKAFDNSETDAARRSGDQSDLAREPHCLPSRWRRRNLSGRDAPVEAQVLLYDNHTSTSALSADHITIATSGAKAWRCSDHEASARPTLEYSMIARSAEMTIWCSQASQAACGSRASAAAPMIVSSSLIDGSMRSSLTKAKRRNIAMRA